jgi:hypothetical protein
VRFAQPVRQPHRREESKPLIEAQLRAYESKRDLAAELLESVQQMKAGKTRKNPKALLGIAGE